MITIIIKIFVIVWFFSLFLLSIKDDIEERKTTNTKNEKEKFFPTMLEATVGKENVAIVKSCREKDKFLRRIGSVFTKVFPEGKILQNVKIKNPITDDVSFIDLMLFTTKGLYIVDTKNLIGRTVFVHEDEEEWKTFRFDGNTYDSDLKIIKNPILELNEKIDFLENLDLKYNFYWESILVFGPDTDYKIYTNQEENIFKLGSFEYFLNQLKEEEDLFSKEKIEYLYKYFVSKKI